MTQANVGNRFSCASTRVLVKDHKASFYKPEDQWSCKRSPDYFPGINTTVKQEKILMSIKGCYSVANLQKMMLYNPNLDLVNDNVYTKFGHILSISSQDIE